MRSVGGYIGNEQWRVILEKRESRLFRRQTRWRRRRWGRRLDVWTIIFDVIVLISPLTSLNFLSPFFFSLFHTKVSLSSFFFRLTSLYCFIFGSSFGAYFSFFQARTDVELLFFQISPAAYSTPGMIKLLGKLNSINGHWLWEFYFATDQQSRAKCGQDSRVSVFYFNYKIFCTDGKVQLEHLGCCMYTFLSYHVTAPRVGALLRHGNVSKVVGLCQSTFPVYLCSWLCMYVCVCASAWQVREFARILYKRRETLPAILHVCYCVIPGYISETMSSRLRERICRPVCVSCSERSSTSERRDTRGDKESWLKVLWSLCVPLKYITVQFRD